MDLAGPHLKRSKVSAGDETPLRTSSGMFITGRGRGRGGVGRVCGGGGGGGDGDAVFTHALWSGMTLLLHLFCVPSHLHSGDIHGMLSMATHGRVKLLLCHHCSQLRGQIHVKLRPSTGLDTPWMQCPSRNAP